MMMMMRITGIYLRDYLKVVFDSALVLQPLSGWNMGHRLFAIL
jgi:hypothetical protein